MEKRKLLNILYYEVSCGKSFQSHIRFRLIFMCYNEDLSCVILDILNYWMHFLWVIYMYVKVLLLMHFYSVLQSMDIKIMMIIKATSNERFYMLRLRIYLCLSPCELYLLNGLKTLIFLSYLMGSRLKYCHNGVIQGDMLGTSLLLGIYVC